MSKPWSIRRQKRFWQLCGWARRTYGGGWKSAELPDLDPNNLYAYAIPRVRAQGYSLNIGLYREDGNITIVTALHRNCRFIDVKDLDPVLALATACEKALMTLDTKKRKPMLKNSNIRLNERAMGA